MRVRRTISWLSDNPNSIQLFVPGAFASQLFTLSDNRRRLLIKELSRENARIGRPLLSAGQSVSLKRKSGELVEIEIVKRQ